MHAIAFIPSMKSTRIWIIIETLEGEGDAGAKHFPCTHKVVRENRYERNKIQSRKSQINLRLEFGACTG